MIGKICNGIATLGPIGYFSAPGTTATIVSVPLMYYTRFLFPNDLHYAAIVGIFSLVGSIIVHYALVHDERIDDPEEIVLDECIGTLIAFWAVPLSPQSLIVGLIVLRLLAILKIGAVHDQKIISAPAIILDDIVAAALTNVLLHIVF